jgi:hypothetical protein
MLVDKLFIEIDACVRRWHDTAVRPLRSVRQDIRMMRKIVPDRWGQSAFANVLSSKLDET